MCRLIGLAAFTFCLTRYWCQANWSHETTADLQILRLSRGSTASRAERACAVLLPTASVCKMSTETPRMGTTVCEFGPAVVWPYNDRYGNTKFAALCLALARNPFADA